MARTIEFDRTQVLENATDVFWRDGYCMTSVSRLVEATRLNPGSIYSAFKSKEGLFLAALEYYGQQGLEKVRRYLNDASSPLGGVKLFLQKITDEMVSDQSRRGCFLVNTVLEMSPNNAKIQETATRQLDALENLLTAAFYEAKDRGELPHDKDPKTLAKFVMVNIWGLRVLSKTGADEAIIRQQLAQLLGYLES